MKSVNWSLIRYRIQMKKRYGWSTIHSTDDLDSAIRNLEEYVRNWPDDSFRLIREESAEI